MEELTRLPLAELRESATAHRIIADEIAATSVAHLAVTAMLDSLGPVFADLRNAGHMLLEQRASCYQRLSAVHAGLSDNLIHVAQEWERADGDAAIQLTTLGERS